MDGRCDFVPLNPKDGDVFVCSQCGMRAEFVVSSFNGHGEWVFD